MPGFLDTVLGLGYAGYASINGTFVPLLPSQTEEQENLYRSHGALSAQVQSSVGEVPHRNRRHLSFHLTTDLCSTTIGLLATTCLTWRSLGSIAFTVPIVVVAANGEGYAAPEAFIDDVTVTVPHEGAATVTFQGTAFRWTPTVGTTTPPSQRAFNFFNTPPYQPIPFWDTTVVHTGLTGTVLEWGLSLKNNWNFRHLLESTPLPPTPRVAVVGPLFSSLSTVVLTVPNSPPQESGSALVTIGGGSPGMTSAPVSRLTFPFMFRDPHRSYEGIGSQNSLIHWGTQWFSLGTVPTFT